MRLANESCCTETEWVSQRLASGISLEDLDSNNSLYHVVTLSDEIMFWQAMRGSGLGAVATSSAFGKLFSLSPTEKSSDVKEGVEQLARLLEPFVSFSNQLLAGRSRREMAPLEMIEKLNELVEALRAAWGICTLVNGSVYWLFGANRAKHLLDRISTQVGVYTQVTSRSLVERCQCLNEGMIVNRFT